LLIPDVNLLVYAYNSDAPFHGGAKRWWEETLSGEVTVGLPWVVLLGFLRVMTSRAILIRPLPPGEALAHIRSWLECPQAVIVHPGPRHLALLESLSASTGVAARLTTDLHLAALAVELRAELHSNDSDFGRFPGLTWINPLESAERR
jgi:uncharacterized protein